MGGIFKSFAKVFGFGGDEPKAYPLPPPPPPPRPTVDNKAAELEAAAQEARRRSASTGRASDMLTGGKGVDDDLETAKKKLLGS